MFTRVESNAGRPPTGRSSPNMVPPGTAWICSLFKEFGILKKLKLQLQARAFKITNTPNFSNCREDLRRQRSDSSRPPRPNQKTRQPQLPLKAAVLNERAEQAIGASARQWPLIYAMLKGAKSESSCSNRKILRSRRVCPFAQRGIRFAAISPGGHRRRARRQTAQPDDA